jgi:hypothetical protein
MKFNWGTGIATFYSIFALTMVGLAIKSTFSPVLLEKKNYYDDDINYQAMMNKKQNSQALTHDVKIVYQSEVSELHLYFPTELPPPTGKITFFRPSSLTKDSVITIQTDTARHQVIGVQNFQIGLWRVQIDWQSDGKTYWKEEKIYIDNFDPARPPH